MNALTGSEKQIEFALAVRKAALETAEIMGTRTSNEKKIIANKELAAKIIKWLETEMSSANILDKKDLLSNLHYEDLSPSSIERLSIKLGL